MTLSPTVLRCRVGNVRWCALDLALLSILLTTVDHSCRILSLSPTRDGLHQCVEGCDGGHVQVSQRYEQAETRFKSLKVFSCVCFS